MEPTIETVSGKFVNVLTPNPDDLLIEDIAWSISRISRFAGHTIPLQPYTVGQHSIFVADMIWQETRDIKLALYGLLHDAAEAFIGDIPSPVKHVPSIRSEINKIEDNLLSVIMEKFIGETITAEEWSKIKFYDKRAQFIEAHAFMVSRGKDWYDRDKHDITLLDLQKFTQPKPSVEVFEEFMSIFDFYSAVFRGEE